MGVSRTESSGTFPPVTAVTGAAGTYDARATPAIHGSRGGRKVQYAPVLVDALDLDRIPRPLEAALGHG